MRTELIIDGNAVYEIDIDCIEHQMAREHLSDAGGFNRVEIFAGETCNTHRVCRLLLLLLFLIR